MDRQQAGKKRTCFFTITLYDCVLNKPQINTVQLFTTTVSDETTRSEQHIFDLPALMAGPSTGKQLAASNRDESINLPYIVRDRKRCRLMVSTVLA